MSKLTPSQRALARHALGLPNKYKQSLRNRYSAGATDSAFDEWHQMVADGNAGFRDGATLSFYGDSLFWLTQCGADQALEPDESLDREDFPAWRGKPTADELLEILKDIRSEMRSVNGDCAEPDWKDRGIHAPNCWCIRIAEIDEMLKKAEAKK